jgi:hypothetical protein
MDPHVLTGAQALFVFELKGRSAARSYKKKMNAGSYISCDYIKNTQTHTLANLQH